MIRNYLHMTLPAILYTCTVLCVCLMDPFITINYKGN